MKIHGLEAFKEPAAVKDEPTWKRAKKAVDPEGKGKKYDEPWAVVMDVYKKMGGTFTKKKESEEPSAGIQTKWDWHGVSVFESKQFEPPTAEQKTKPQAPTTALDTVDSSEGGDEEARKLLIQSPDMSAATFYQTLKAKGLKIVDTKSDTINQAQTKSKEAEVSSGNVAVTRESEKTSVTIKCTMHESEPTPRNAGIGHTKFRVVILKEGLGNFVDGMYYTKEALKSALANGLFEGSKIYADHPDKIQEQTLPERSVRDIIGHLESVRIEECEDGQSALVADAVAIGDEPFRWARALMAHAVEFSKKFLDRNFVGLSINANGNAIKVPLSDYLKEADIPKPAIPKLQQALEKGLEVLKVVTSLDSAKSVDLVTEAGAGGQILQTIS